MITRTWYEFDIKKKQDILKFIRLFKEHKPKHAGFDTETNGLHIISSRPFLLAFGFISTVTGEGFTWTHDFELHPELTTDVMFAVIELFNQCYRTVAHNAKYDLHELANIGYYLPFKNITDSMIYIRFAHDSLKQSEGGAPLQLKAYANAYIDRNARIYEKELKREQEYLTKARNRELKNRLANYGRWTLGKIHDILSDKVIGIEGFPKEIRPIVQKWYDETPDPDNYQNLNREKVTRYAHKDIVYMLECVELTYPVLLARGQEKGLEIEEDLILPLFRMERIGFAFNKEYTLQAKVRVKDYILRLRNHVTNLAGVPVATGQHKLIKTTIEKLSGITLESTGADVLAQTKFEGKAKDFVDTILKLRTLEKWYSTYIMKWLNEEVNGRVYTTINQVGAVSGRVTSNFQQFPGYAIYDEEGNEVFHPRKMIRISNDKDYIAYLDYSQIELRFQAIYTIYVSGGDTNLCRAYMPFKCVRLDEMNNRISFDYTKDLGIIDNYDWYYEEDETTKWKPIDLHSTTTKAAFPDIDENHPEWKHYRKMGKTTNFACNYNARASTLHYRMGYDWDLANKLYDAYNASFPEVDKYREYVNRMINHQGYLENLFGVKYYGCSAHNGSNYLVQGSAAYFMKLKIIAVDKYLLENPSSVKLQMTIHDELSEEGKNEDLAHVLETSKIMSELEGTPVPIVTDIELTITNWAEKKDYVES